MALDNILSTIEEETKRQVEAVEQDGLKQKENLQKTLDIDLEEKKQELIKHVEYQAAKKVSQANWEMSSQIRTALLKKKQQLLNKVFEDALSELANLSDDKYVALLVRLLNELPDLDDSAKIVPAKNKERLTLQAINKAGSNLSVKQESVNKYGGFLVETKDMTIDMTFESLIRSYQSDHETDVAAKLFDS